MCRHNWINALPDSKEVAEHLKIDYVLEKMLARIGDIFYCNKCGKTGHAIKSHRGGIRVHYHSEGYFVNKANEIREKFSLPLLSIEQNDKRSAATEAK